MQNRNKDPKAGEKHGKKSRGAPPPYASKTVKKPYAAVYCRVASGPKKEEPSCES